MIPMTANTTVIRIPTSAMRIAMSAFEMTFSFSAGAPMPNLEATPAGGGSALNAGWAERHGSEYTERSAHGPDTREHVPDLALAAASRESRQFEDPRADRPTGQSAAPSARPCRSRARPAP